MNTTRTIFTTICIMSIYGTFALSVGADTVTWTGPANGDFWTEANWDLNGGPANPPAGAINNGTNIVYDVIFTNGSAFTGHNAGGVNPNGGTSWQISNSLVDLGDENPGASTRGQGGVATINLLSGSTYETGWTQDVAYVVDATSQVVFRNGNTNGIINGSGSVNLAGIGASVWYKSSAFNATNIAVDFNQIMVNGQSLNYGLDLEILEKGDNVLVTAGPTGMMITAAEFSVPEPSTIVFALVSVLILGLVERTRRKCGRA